MKGTKFDSYITMGAERIVIKKDDKSFKGFFSEKRKAFPFLKFSADFDGKPLNISKIEISTHLNGRQAFADLMGGWGVLDRIPYSFTTPTIELRVGTTADSPINSSIAMFNNITSVVSDASVSAATASGAKIAEAVDRYFFAEGRTIDALTTSFQFPQSASGELCVCNFRSRRRQQLSEVPKFKRDFGLWNP